MSEKTSGYGYKAFSLAERQRKELQELNRAITLVYRPALEFQEMEVRLHRGRLEGALRRVEYLKFVSDHGCEVIAKLSNFALEGEAE